MPRFVVLLRGVNVGKGNRVPMAEFRSMLQGLGCSDVTTLLNSGNAVFSSPGRSAVKHSQSIASALETTIGVKVAVVVKTSSELEAVVAGNPNVVPEADHSKLLVAFANDAATLQDLEHLQTLVQAPESLVFGPAAAYLYCATGVLESKVGAALLGKTGQAVTTRNWATTLKLLALCNGRQAK